MRKKFAKKMLEENLDFLPLEESIALFDSGVELNTRFWWVCRNEELDNNGEDMNTEEIISSLEEIYGELDDYYITIGKQYDEFDEFTLPLAPAPTLADLTK
jgi:hypothetical protein